MRSLVKVYCGLVLISLLAMSCSKDEDVAIIRPVPFEVQLSLNEDFANKALEGVSVTLMNRQTSVKYEAISDATGKAFFEALNPGTYNIDAEYSLTAEAYKALFNIETDQELTNFNASLDNITINNISLGTRKLVLETAQIGDLLFKQIYYAGSSRSDGANFRDGFVEIYNNSNKTIYADSLYFGIAYGRDLNSVAPFTLANGQMDWRKSIGQSKGEASNQDFVYADNVFQIRGTGEDHPILPGESIVIAATAINHKQPLTTATETFSVKKPELTVDLSVADFEAFLAPAREANGQSTLASDIDNPLVEDLHPLLFVGKELVLNPDGKDSFVIFRINDIDSLDRLPRPDKKEVNAMTRLYLQIPNSVIIDAVNTDNSNNDHLYPKRISSALDGGFKSVPKGPFSSQAIIRKVAEIFGSRRVLQDTNNSTNDFEVIDRPLPKGWK